MKFIIDVPNDMVHWDHGIQATKPEDIMRLMRSHLAHIGTVTIEPMIEGGPEDTMHALAKIEARLADKEYYMGLMCNCKEAEESQGGLYKRWTCYVHGEQTRCYE